MRRFAEARQAIALAQSSGQVCELLDGCMRGLPSVWLMALPQSCQHIIQMPARDIPAAATDLVRMEMVFTGGNEAAQVLREIAHTYTVAATRLAKLHR